MTRWWKTGTSQDGRSPKAFLTITAWPATTRPGGCWGSRPRGLSWWGRLLSPASLSSATDQRGRVFNISKSPPPPTSLHQNRRVTVQLLSVDWFTTCKIKVSSVLVWSERGHGEGWKRNRMKQNCPYRHPLAQSPTIQRLTKPSQQTLLYTYSEEEILQDYM